MCLFLSFLTRTKEEKWRFLKDARGGGGTHRSWPGGQGGRPRALVAGEGCVGAGWQFQTRKRVGAWLAVPKRGKSREGLACLAVPQEGARARGGIQGLRFRKGRCVVFRKL